MPNARSRRRQRELDRQREGRNRRARETQRAQAEAAARKNLQRGRRHRIEGVALLVLGVVIAVMHFFEHAGTLNLMSQNLEDLLLGFPVAGILALVGAVRLGT